MEVIKLWNDKREREMYENFSELYATEKLEKAYIRDLISPSQYETECQKLIVHFKTLSATTLKDSVPNVERFADTYKMDCSAAVYRGAPSRRGGVYFQLCFRRRRGVCSEFYYLYGFFEA